MPATPKLGITCLFPSKELHQSPCIKRTRSLESDLLKSTSNIRPTAVLGSLRALQASTALKSDGLHLSDLVEATNNLITLKEELAEIRVKRGEYPVTFLGAGIAFLGFTGLVVLVMRKYLNQSDHDASMRHEADGRDVDIDIDDPGLSADDWDMDSFDDGIEPKEMKQHGQSDLSCDSSDQIFDASCQELF
jgi:hypothetical protein